MVAESIPLSPRTLFVANETGQGEVNNALYVV